MILSVVAILNIVGFMYISGNAFMLSWQTPVRVSDDHSSSNEHKNIPGILRPDKKRDSVPEDPVINQVVVDTYQKQQNQSLEPLPNSSIVVNKSEGDQSKNPGLVVKILQPPEQRKLPSTQQNKSANVELHPAVADKIQAMKEVVEAHIAEVANTNIQLGTNEQVVNPAVSGPEPDPSVRHIDPAILQGIVSKAKPPNTEKVFPHNFKLVINEPTACQKTGETNTDVYLLVLVNSIHKNFEQRRAIRNTWGSVKTANGKRVLTLFTLAKNSDKGLNKKVEEESNQHHDILLEDFIDTYKNLTLKTIMGVKYAATYCGGANFVMKTDDDMYVNYNSLVTYLASANTPKTNHLAGFVINGSPIRDPKSKWYMPRDLYSGNRYPPFCSGTGYVMSGDVALKLYAISEYTGFLYLEDVFIGIGLQKLGIVPVKHKEFNNWRTGYSFCRFKRIITTHMVTPTEMNRIWKDQNSKKTYRC